jgi:hypothetical protein
MAIQSNFPAIKPTLLLDFANTEQLDPRVTFTRASTATYYGTQTAKAEENLLLQSQDLTTTWSTASQNATVTANTTAAPDGTTTADTLTDNATSGVHRVAQTITTSNNKQLVLSCFLKYSTLQWVSLSAATNTGQWAGAKFDVQNGVLGSTSQQGTDWTANSSSITSVGNGWYRCVLVFTPGNSGSLGVYVNGATDGTTFTTSQRGAEVYTGASSSVFLWGAQLEQRSAVSSYTVTTTQAITNYIPVLQTAASGVARFDHNPTTFESLGLEIEEQRTNLILQSEDLDTTWSETRATLSLNSVVAPNGALTADRLIADTDNNTHFTSQTFTGTAASHTFSVYAKASGLNHVALRLFNGTSQVGLAYYNLSTGATGTVTAGTAAITSVGNGYYRCSLTATLAASASCTADIQLANADNTNSFAGNAFDGVTLWGTQVELGAFATSYIPTVASQVTRSADAASMTGTNFSSWYNQGEGTFYAQFIPATSSFGANKNIFLASDGTVNNYAGLRYTVSGAEPTFSVVVAGTAQAAISTGAMIAGTSYKLAGAYEANDFAVSRNAGTVGTDTSGTIPVVTQAEIGMLAGAAFGTQTISKLAYYPMRVTNAQLQALTS